MLLRAEVQAHDIGLRANELLRARLRANDVERQSEQVRMHQGWFSKCKGKGSAEEIAPPLPPLPVEEPLQIGPQQVIVETIDVEAKIRAETKGKDLLGNVKGEKEDLVRRLDQMCGSWAGKVKVDGKSDYNIDEVLEYISDPRSHAKININFNPFKTTNGGKTVLDLMRCGSERFLNAFEIAGVTPEISGGYKDMGTRKGWEDEMFPEYADAPVNTRPKYGSLNIVNEPYGATGMKKVPTEGDDRKSQYGTSYFIMKEHVKAWCTFTPMDSGELCDERTFARGPGPRGHVGTKDHFLTVLKDYMSQYVPGNDKCQLMYALQNLALGRAESPTICPGVSIHGGDGTTPQTVPDGGDILAFLGNGYENAPPLVSEYFEAQIHADIYLKRDVAGIVLIPDTNWGGFTKARGLLTSAQIKQKLCDLSVKVDAPIFEVSDDRQLRELDVCDGIEATFAGCCE